MLAVGRELPGRPEDHPLLEPPSFGDIYLMVEHFDASDSHKTGQTIRCAIDHRRPGIVQ